MDQIEEGRDLLRVLLNRAWIRGSCEEVEQVQKEPVTAEELEAKIKRILEQ